MKILQGPALNKNERLLKKSDSCNCYSTVATQARISDPCTKLFNKVEQGFNGLAYSTRSESLQRTKPLSRPQRLQKSRGRINISCAAGTRVETGERWYENAGAVATYTCDGSKRGVKLKSRTGKIFQSRCNVCECSLRSLSLEDTVGEGDVVLWMTDMSRGMICINIVAVVFFIT